MIRNTNKLITRRRLKILNRNSNSHSPLLLTTKRLQKRVNLTINRPSTFRRLISIRKITPSLQHRLRIFLNHRIQRRIMRLRRRTSIMTTMISRLLLTMPTRLNTIRASHPKHKNIRTTRSIRSNTLTHTKNTNSGRRLTLISHRISTNRHISIMLTRTMHLLSVLRLSMIELLNFLRLRLGHRRQLPPTSPPDQAEDNSTSSPSLHGRRITAAGPTVTS